MPQTWAAVHTYDAIVIKLKNKHSRKFHVSYLSEVEQVILETSGHLSVMKKSEYTTPTPRDFQISAPPGGLPTVLINNGKLLETPSKIEDYTYNLLKRSRIVVRKEDKFHIKLSVLILFASLFIFITFLLASIFSTLQRSHTYLPASVYQTLQSSPSELFITIMGFENAYFTQNQSERKDFSLPSLGLQLATSVSFGDATTLLGNELPGILSYRTEILTPGQGTDYTNTPVESSPPLEVLLKEREMAQKQLEEYEKGNTPSSPTENLKEKSFYIYQTHSWESYLPLIGLTDDPDADKAVDSKTNITLVGEMLARELEKQNVGAIADQTNMGQELKKKSWGTNKSYTVSRNLVQTAMTNNRDIKYLIDLHRDSLRKDHTTININGESYAKTVFVLGKSNPHFEHNLELAKTLHKALEEKYPGLSRGVIGKEGAGVNGVYNQDLMPNAMLIEIGGVDNNMSELKNTVKALAAVLSEYYWKAEQVNAQN